MNNSYLKLFVDCLEKYQKLNDTEFGRLIRAAISYKATGVEVELTGRENLLWDGMKLDIDRDNERYEQISKTNSENGKKGGRPKKADESENNRTVFSESEKSQDKDKEKEEDKDKEKDKERECGADAPAPQKKFVPPTIDEVKDYCAEKKYERVSAETFVAYYESVGWKVGKNKMQNWRGAIAGWESRERERVGMPQPPKTKTAEAQKSFSDLIADAKERGKLG